jgi:hypothetical protein
MTNRQDIAMDGFNKVKPITEGHVVKGGVNSTSRITTRPPAPAPMRPSDGSVAAGKPATSKSS